MKKISAVFFDIDGVLLDSLEPHLQICVDKRKEFGLESEIPEIPDGKKFKYEVVRNDVKISPMEFFFIAVGFPEEAAKQADADYQNNFAEDYQIEKFIGVDEMLSGLSRAGIKLGIITSNVEPNVSLSLGGSIDYFDPNCRFMNDTHPTHSKSDSIIAGARFLKFAIDNCLYVGDQPADWKAARTAGANFLGVSYGWGISDEDNEFPVVGSVTKLYEVILKMNKSRHGKS